MAFPVSPTDGQVATINGIRYTYSATTSAWTRVATSRYTVSASVPAAASLGDQWYNTNTDVLYEYINDGVANYWVDTTGGGPSGNLTTLSDATLGGNLAPGVNDRYSIGSASGYLKNLYSNNIIGNTQTISGNSSIGGNSTIVGNLTVTGTATLSGGFTTGSGSASLTLAGNVTSANIITGNLFASGNLSSTNQTTGSIAATGLITSANEATGNITASGNVTVAQQITLSSAGNITFAGTLTGGAIAYMFERANVVAASAPSVTNLDLISATVLYWTSNATTNITANIRGNATTSLNSVLGVGQSATVALIFPQQTAYYVNSVQVDGSAVTPVWVGSGSAISSGNANSIDIYSFTVIKLSTVPAYKVFASRTQYIHTG